jgi:hypothetical protein
VTLAAAVGDDDVLSIDEAVARMDGMQRELLAADHDGLRWFNQLYREVTAGVRYALDWAYADPRFIHDLDVNFANRYFAAVRAWERGFGVVPRAWKVLFEARGRGRIQPVQFAAAGVNAHINYDLAQALVRTWEQPERRHVTGDTQWTDYQRVTGIFDANYQRFRAEMLSPRFEGRYDKGRAARAADISSHVLVNDTRELAWLHGRILWDLRVAHAWHLVPDRRPDYVDWVLDRQTAAAGNLILFDLGDAPVGAPPGGDAPTGASGNG